MSQLNSEEKNEVMKEEKFETSEVEEKVNEKKAEESNEKETIVNEPKKKMSGKLKIIIFLIVFTIIAVGITIAAIIVTNNKNYGKVIENKTEIVSDGLGVKSLTEKYNENDLKIIKINEGKGSRVPTTEWDTNTNKIIIDYIQIDGLKNSSIEAEINEEIKNVVYGLFSEEDLNNSQIDYIDIYTYESANFVNTLSINISKMTKFMNSDYNYSEPVYLNFDLTTGNKVKFTDLFTKDASIRNILSQSIYDALITKYVIETDLTTDARNTDLSHVEDENIKILNKCISNIDNLNFGYNSESIRISIEDIGIEIPMEEFYESIAIYNRFLTEESIFDNKYEGVKNLFVFTDIYYDEDAEKYMVYEDIYDNFRTEIAIICSEEVYALEEGKKIYNDYMEKVRADIEKLKVEAKESPAEAIIYTAEYIINGHEDSELIKLNIDNLMINAYGQNEIYRISTHYYKQVLYNEIAEMKRNTGDGGMAPSNVFPPYYWYDSGNGEVGVEEVYEPIETIDIYTKKNRNQLLGEYYINQELEHLKMVQDNLAERVQNIYWENELNYIKEAVNNIKTQYQLTDEDIKEAVDLIAKIREEGAKLRKEIEEKEKAELEAVTPTPSQTPEVTQEPTPTSIPTETVTPTATTTPTSKPTATAVPTQAPIVIPTSTIEPTSVG